jgi:hypothetical protein
MSNIQNITESFKGLSVEELLVIIAAATTEAKKSAKVVAKAPKEAKEKKGSMPKGVSPPQLHKPRAWVDFVLARANTVGWPAITVKDTEALPASVERDGKYVFEATGKPLNNKQAMSLSKQYWARKEAKGTNKELYDEFEAQYVAPEPAAPKESSVEVAASAAAESDAESESSVEVSLEVPAAPKEKKEKKAKKTEEEKEAEKVAKKEAADLKKTQEKEAKALAKAQEKEAKKAAPKEEKPKEAEASKEEAPKAKPVAMKLKKAAPKVEELPFDIEADTMVHEWVFQGKKVYVNSDGEMWQRSDSDEAGPWMGKYDPTTKVLDASASEPLYADEE